MPERHELEGLFLSNLHAVERILSALARRHTLSRDTAEEFSAWAKLQLIKDDYAIIAKFRGESSLSTYLTVVLSMLYREYRVQEWGRWRPSAAAKRLGRIAIRIEELVMRDELPLTQAGQVLRTSGATTLSDRELGEIIVQLPRRAPLRPVELAKGDAGIDAEGADRADAFVDDEEAVAENDETTRALAEALKTLPTEDSLIVRMHFMEDMSVADIARGLDLPQKPLYRRLERTLHTLRTRLERAGISRERVGTLSSDPR